jgi:hypothetical protein
MWLMSSVPGNGGPSPELKLQLEIQKLQEEINGIRYDRRWFTATMRNVKVTEWVTAAVACTALVMAFWTGIFDATRQRLEAQQERLAVEKIHLQQLKAKLTEEVAGKTRDLETLTRRLQPFEREQVAIEKLRKLQEADLLVQLDADYGFDGIKVSMTHWGKGILRKPTRNNAESCLERLVLPLKITLCGTSTGQTRGATLLPRGAKYARWPCESRGGAPLCPSSL